MLLLCMHICCANEGHFAKNKILASSGGERLGLIINLESPYARLKMNFEIAFED